MNAALWGLAAALAFGIADFCGRFTGRALGSASAMLGLMLVGAVLLTAHALTTGIAASCDWSLVMAGATAMVAPLAFYRAMTLASLSLVMPITAAYPALVVPVSLVMGATPAPLQWAGMALTGLGAVVVARTAADDPDAALTADPANRRSAIRFAALACILFAAALLLGGQSAAKFGAGTTLWLGRLIGVGLLLLAFAARRRKPRLPVRWMPVLAVQGGLDASAYYFFYLGARGDDAAIAAVASSAFMVVGVLLGWAFLKERVGPACWAGVCLVFSGVVLLSI